MTTLPSSLWTPPSRLTRKQRLKVARLDKIIREACKLHVARSYYEYLVVPSFEATVSPCHVTYLADLYAVLYADEFIMLRYRVDNEAFPRDYFEAAFVIGTSRDLILSMGNVTFLMEDLEAALDTMFASINRSA